MLAGKYELEKQLGRGAAGAVWAAVNVVTKRRVALKVLLDPEPRAAERLLREARAAGALKHPNVVDVYDVIVAEDGSPVLVLELLCGQTLEDLIRERAPMAQHEVAPIGRDVARALAVAHASGIVHRDLKPANIFLHRFGDAEPVVKVVDFGISKNLLSDDGTLTQTGMAVGSPPFMSPEQVRGESEIDGRADLWALGVILYEMLSEVRLFEGRPHEVLMQVLNRPIRPIDELVPGLDPALVRLVGGLLERDLAKRTASADEVAEWLATIATTARARRSLLPPRDPDAAETGAIPVLGMKSPVADLAARTAELPSHDGAEDEDDVDDDAPTRVAPPSMRSLALEKASVRPAPPPVIEKVSVRPAPSVIEKASVRPPAPVEKASIRPSPPVIEKASIRPSPPVIEKRATSSLRRYALEIAVAILVLTALVLLFARSAR